MLQRLDLRAGQIPVVANRCDGGLYGAMPTLLPSKGDACLACLPAEVDLGADVSLHESVGREGLPGA